ncbi:MAG: tetratricopeptide repeat protein [Candidatus Coatesbacteria bacterium]|nr:MAG: tetratricopeptide repeat protein [Candidatus Coatesbacteria bacterium]
MRPEFNDWLKKYRWPLALAATVVVVRVAYFITVADDPFFTHVRNVPDAAFFNNWAQEISSGEWAGGEDVFFIGPLYAYFLGIIYRAIGPHVTAVRFVHIALDAAAALFLFGFARRAFGEGAAKVAGVIWALYLPAIFFTSFLLPVSLDVFLITGSFYLLARGVAGRWGNFAGAGALLGLAVLDRTNLLIFVLAAVLLFLAHVKRLKWGRLAAYFAPIAVIVLAASARNALVGGDVVVVSSQGGLNFYLGNSANAAGVYWNLGDVYAGDPGTLNRDAATGLAERALGRRLKPSEVQRWFYARGFAWLRDNPGDAVRLYWRKLRLLTNDYEVSLNADFYFRRFVSLFHRAPFPWFAFVLAFGAIGMARGWRGSPFARTAGVLFVATYAVSVLAFFVSARYRLPAVPLLIAFASAGLVRWYDLWRRWRWRSAAALTAAVFALGAFSVWPVKGIRYDVPFGQAYYQLGKFYFEEGDYGEAIHYLNKATAAAPAFYQSFIMLGVAYETLGRTETALDAFRCGTLAAPDAAETHYNYGVALGRAGRFGEALPPLYRAVELDPGYEAAWVQLGEVSIALGDYRRAEAAYRRAVGIPPREPRTMSRYAEILVHIGDNARALPWAEAAAEADPNLPGTHFTAGRICFERGDYAAAVAYLEREAELQPHKPEVFGLLAVSYAELMDGEAAARAYEKYEALGGSADPDFEREVGLPPR